MNHLVLPQNTETECEITCIHRLKRLKDVPAKTCTEMFTTASFIITRKETNTNVHQLVNKQNVVNPPNMISLSYKQG